MGGVIVKKCIYCGCKSNKNQCLSSNYIIVYGIIKSNQYKRSLGGCLSKA